MIQAIEDGELITTCDFIAVHARSNPTDIAVIDNGKRVTYADFQHDLYRFRCAVGDFKFGVGDTVAIEWTSQ